MRNIVIGSANFNQKYGFKKFKFNKNILKKIMQLAKKKKINYLDTAFDYNLTKQFLKNISFEKYKLITKIKLPKKKINNYIENLEKKILLELKLFKAKKFEAVLLHNPEDLFSKNGKYFLGTLNNLKKKKIIKNIGISVYEPRELKATLKIFKPNIVQLPINIFDQRFIKNRWINKLKKKNIKIQARSIFLNGLMLKERNQLKNFKYLKEFKPHLTRYNLWCLKNKVSELEAAVLFIKNIKKIDLITIGFDSYSQFQQILIAFNKKKKINFNKLNILNRNITDPRRW